MLTCKDDNGVLFGQTGYDGRSLVIPRHISDKFTASKSQYWAVKSRHMDILCFFQVGTFYELYEDDASVVHSAFGLNITYTGCTN